MDLTLVGDRHDDILFTGKGADHLFGADGNDQFHTGAGNDVLIGDQGSDQLDGGADYDTADYSGGDANSDNSGTSGIFANLTVDPNALVTGTVVDNWGNTDSLTSIENIIGTDYADTMAVSGNAGDALGTVFFDARGSASQGDSGDTVDFSGLTGTTGIFIDLAAERASTASNLPASTTSAILGFENVIGTTGDDTITGDASDNLINGGGGADIIDGGAGVDTLVFDPTHGAIDIDLGAGTINTGGTVTGIEGVVGTNGNYNFVASDTTTHFAGGDGADTFVIKPGGAGNIPTVVWGGAGADVIDLQNFVEDANGNSLNDPAGILVVNVTGLTEANFHQFDIDNLGFGSGFDWSEFDAVVLNPDASDTVIVDGQTMDIVQTSYDIEFAENYPQGFNDNTGPESFYTFSVPTATYSTSNALFRDSTVVGDYHADFLGPKFTTVFGGGAHIRATVLAEELDGPGGSVLGENPAWYQLVDPSTANVSVESQFYHEVEDYTSYHNNYLWVDYSASPDGTPVPPLPSGRGPFDVVSDVPIFTSSVGFNGWFVAGGSFSGTVLSPDGSIDFDMVAPEDIIQGSPSDGSLIANSNDNLINSGAGNQVIASLNGQDTMIFGIGDGQDTITDLDPVNDTIKVNGFTITDLLQLPVGVTGAQVGPDYQLSYGSGDTILIQGSPALQAAYPTLFTNPNQTLTGTSGKDVLTGGVGDDTIDGLGDNDTLYGGAGNDTITDTSGNNNMFGEAGNDTIIGGNAHDTLTGGTGDDTLTGGNGRNNYKFATGDGSDVITDFDIEDKIFIDGVEIGDPDNLPAGVTAVDGAVGLEISYGSGDLITLTGVTYAQFYDMARMVLNGGAGDDTLIGRSNDDTLTGNDGNDTLTGNGKRDILYGNAGNDALDGGDDHDQLYGGDGDDVLTDPSGNNLMMGQAGIDTITGGNGHDRINGGTGDDLLTGGLGTDTFEFTTGDGTDTITDFSHADDTIKFVGTGLAFGDLTITEVGSDVNVGYGANDLIVLQGLTAAELASDDFLFA